MRVRTFNMLKWWLFPIWLIWDAPTFLLGSAVWLYNRIAFGRCMREISTGGIAYYKTSSESPTYGVSLFPFIFLSEKYGDDEVSCQHEMGHCIQAMMLGPSYLIIIGIPSGTSNVPWLNRIIRGRERNTPRQYYCGFWWERTADELGGVTQVLMGENLVSRIPKTYIQTDSPYHSG